MKVRSSEKFMNVIVVKVSRRRWCLSRSTTIKANTKTLNEGISIVSPARLFFQPLHPDTRAGLQVQSAPALSFFCVGEGISRTQTTPPSPHITQSTGTRYLQLKTEVAAPPTSQFVRCATVGHQIHGGPSCGPR